MARHPRGKYLGGMPTLAADDPSVHTQQPSVEGKNVLVSGGTTGNGRAIAELLAAYGANVFIFGRHEAELREALTACRRGRGRAHGIVADQARAEDIARLFATTDRELGGLDFLVNNAAVPAGGIEEGDDAAWRYRLEADLLGYIDCTRHALRRMRARGGGHVVNVGSISAVHHNKGMSLYVAAKSAIRGFSRALRKEVAEDNIKVSLIEPGMIGTDFLGGEEGDPEVQRRDEERGAMLKPEDIAVAVHYILTQPPRCTISLLQIEPRLED